MNRNYKFFVAFAIAVVTLLIATALWLLKISTTGGPEQKREADAAWIDTEAEEIVFEPVESDTETETVFEPVLETETEAETKTAIPDTSDVAPKMDEQNEDTAQNISKSDFNAAFSDDDLICLAKIVQNEAGSDYCTDEHQRYVASVVLNRVASPRFPGDTILEIALCGYGDGYPIQYMYSLDPNEGEAMFWQIEPTERAIENARYVLENGVLDESVVWQAEFIQGEIVAEFAYPEIYSSVTYICR